MTDRMIQVDRTTECTTDENDIEQLVEQTTDSKIEQQRKRKREQAK